MGNYVLSFGTMNTSQNRFFWRGAYSAGTIYNAYDVVSYLGAAYISLTTQTGVLPTTTGSWDQMTSAGAVTSVAGRVGNVVLSSADLTDKDSANGVAGLDANAFLKSAEFNLTINAQTGTTYTIAASDRGKLLTFNNAGAVAAALPQATGSFASGWFCEVENLGAGLVTITPTTSTVDGAATVTLKQFESVTLVSNGTNYLCLRSKVRASFADITGTVDATQLPAPTATTLGGVESKAAVAHNFLTAINTDGTVSQAQPVFSDISGTAAATQLPTPTASTLGGIQSFAAQTSKWINAISTAGVPSATQPASTDLSDVATLATLTGTQTLTNKTLTAPKIGTETISAAPRMTWGIDFIANLNNTSGVFKQWVLDKGITITRIDMVYAGTTGAGSTVAAKLRVTDGTTNTDVSNTNGAGSDTSGAISVNYAAGATLQIKTVAGTGYTTNPTNVVVTVQYKMQ